MIRGGQYLDVLMAGARSLAGILIRLTREVVLDPRVGNLNFPVNERQLELLGHLLFDLGHVTLRIGLAFGIDRLLYLGLDLEVEFHAQVAATPVLDAFSFLPVGTIDLRVMFGFARLDQTGIDPLVFGEIALLQQQAATVFGERDDLHALNRAPLSIAAQIDVRGLDQSFVAEIPEVVLKRAGFSVV